MKDGRLQRLLNLANGDGVGAKTGEPSGWLSGQKPLNDLGVLDR